MGGFFVHHFLTNITTPEWRAKYIDCAILLAPSLGGSGPAFNSVWTKELPFLSILGRFPDLMSNLGGLDIHMLNFEIFKDTVIFQGQDGTQRKAPDVVNLFNDHGILPPNGMKIFEKYIPFFATAPQPLDVPTALFYNSKLSTSVGINQSAGTDDFIWGYGDLLVNKEGPEYVCNKWKSAQVVDCYDLHSDLGFVDHVTMLWNTELLEFVVNHVTNSSWQHRL
jgi:lecithin-cholesterol acyltransferase